MTDSTYWRRTGLATTKGRSKAINDLYVKQSTELDPAEASRTREGLADARDAGAELTDLLFTPVLA